MSPREDEVYRQVRYGGHPPACTCVECCEKRRRGESTGYRGDRVGGGTPAWFWAIIGIVIIALILTLVLK